MSELENYGVSVEIDGWVQVDPNLAECLLATAVDALSDEDVRHWREVLFPREVYSCDAKDAYVHLRTWGDAPGCEACLMGDFAIMALDKFEPLGALTLVQIQHVAHRIFTTLKAGGFTGILARSMELHGMQLWLDRDDLGEVLMTHLSETKLEDDIKDYMDAAGADMVNDCNLESVHQLLSRRELSDIWRSMETREI